MAHTHIKLLLLSPENSNLDVNDSIKLAIISINAKFYDHICFISTNLNFSS